MTCSEEMEWKPTRSLVKMRNLPEDDKMRSGADLRGGTPLVSFNHVIDPHFVTFSNSLY